MRHPAITLLLWPALAIITATSGASAQDAPTTLADKTLVVWARPADFIQRGSGLLAVQDREEFDAIVLGERVERRWMAGSHVFSRTQSPQAQVGLPIETREAGDAVRIAIVYRGRTIEIWRDDTLYVSYQAANQQIFRRRSDVYIGLRCVFGGKQYGHFRGRIDEARLYDMALTEEQLGKLRLAKTAETENAGAGQPVPKPFGCWTFDAGSLADRMGNFPAIQLIDTARVENDALLLDGSGYALVSERREITFRPPDETSVQAGFYTPPHRPGQLWDTWLYHHEGLYYMYYLAGKMGRWDAHELAVSTDAVHWHYHGKVAGPRPGTKWMGTGHLWKSPNFEASGRWVMNYSEWFGPKQDIMFATSTDLVNWRKVDESFRFVQDTRWYKSHGRWDCIDTIPGDDGYLYGYYTATPDSTNVAYQHCGFGFARSKDGIRWEALPPLPGDMHGEFGGVEKIGARYYITISEGRIGVGDHYKGPFQKQEKNHNIFGGDVYFPRFFHGTRDGVLMNHFYRGGPVYAAPVKAVECDRTDGTLRLVWWPGNEALKAIPLPIEWEMTPHGGDQSPEVRWLAKPIDVNRTTVLETTLRLERVARTSSVRDDVNHESKRRNNRDTSAGIAPGESDDDSLHGIVFDQGGGSVECISFEPSVTHFGHASTNKLSARRDKLSIDRSIHYGREQRIRVVMNRDMMEVYVNNYLTLMVRTRNVGRIGFVSSGAFEEVHLWQNADTVERPEL